MSGRHLVSAAATGRSLPIRNRSGVFASREVFKALEVFDGLEDKLAGLGFSAINWVPRLFANDQAAVEGAVASGGIAVVSRPSGHPTVVMCLEYSFGEQASVCFLEQYRWP